VSQSVGAVAVAKELQTSTDKKLAATVQLFEASNRVTNIINELQICVKALEDKNCTFKKRNDSARSIKKIIIPALSQISTILNNAGKTTSPIAGVKYQCDKKEIQKKRDALKMLTDPSNKRKSADHHLLECYSATATVGREVTPKQKKKKQRTVTPECNDNDTSELVLSLPPPINGSQYDKHEVINILKVYPLTGSSEKAAKIGAMIKQKLVPCHAATIYRLMDNHHAGKVSSPYLVCLIEN
jgi:hypothetical protein